MLHVLSCHFNHSALSRASILRNMMKTSPAVFKLFNMNLQYFHISRKMGGQTTNFRDLAPFHDTLECKRNLIANLSTPSHFSYVHQPRLGPYSAQQLNFHQARQYSIQQPNFREKLVSSDSNNLKFIDLYFIRYIQFLGSICRLSLYSCVFFLLGSPICALSLYYDLYPIESVSTVFRVLTFYMIVFTSQSFLFISRIVGKIMISEAEEKVIISHLTLFGKRKDVCVNRSDLIKLPLDGDQLMSKRMVTLRFHNRSEKFMFFPHYGGFDTNHEALEVLLCSKSKNLNNKRKS